MITPSSSRRLWLRRASALGAGTVLAGCAPWHDPQPSSTSGATPMLDKHLDILFDQLLTEAPQEATALGLDTGARAPLRHRWADRSLDAARSRNDRYIAALARLRATPRQGLDRDAAATFDAACFALELGVEGTRFAYGDQGLMATLAQEGTPYVINQMIGLALSAPQFLATQHPLRTPQDRDAWLHRLAALPAHIDHETERLRHDAALGVRAPRFVLATLHEQLDAMLATPPAEARLLTALAATTNADKTAASAFDHLQRGLYPAVQRQRDAVSAVMTSANDEAGVRRLPDGERYYAWALRVGTTTTLAAGEIHRIGRAQAAEIDAQMDSLLRAQGLTQGSVGQRMAALGQDARHCFTNDDAGRALAIAHCNEWVARVRAAMPRWSALALRAPLDVKRVPPEIEAGAAGAYVFPGALDGSRDSVFYLNLRDTATWPRWTLPTLVVHETLPGHVWQEAHETEVVRRHPLRALLKFNGYSEGWALYAEQLVDDAGFYEDDPLARLGYLQAQQLRATRLVVDTGLHAFGWSRERAIQTLAEATGRPRAAVQGEIDRYCVKPGQACGYKIGQTELLRLRQQWLARRPAPGGGTTVAFNDAVLGAGNLPLAVLARTLGVG
ncbi:MAG TPA: DUF885 family protein [Ideonella sp.]|nr:DUF885 family protein [Ideonella sp.]HEX5684907.1 DUF885 family protein [Ideonella sp.]